MARVCGFFLEVALPGRHPRGFTRWPERYDSDNKRGEWPSLPQVVHEVTTGGRDAKSPGPAGLAEWWAALGRRSNCGISGSDIRETCALNGPSTPPQL